MIIDAPKTADFPALRALWQQAFGDTEAFLDVFFSTVFFSTAFSPARCRCVTANGETAAALYWFDCSCRGKKLAYLYAVATAKFYRGRGLCAALMTDTHRHLLSQGYAGTILVPGTASLFAFYEKMGYHACCGVREFSCTASDERISLHTVGTEEYTRLRREYLPKGGVVQEGENARFLAEQATLYTGDGFLLAARREGDALHGLELLGDTDKVPAILRALDCVKGRFRTVGNDRPFAMYRATDDSPLPPPSYFGLAFD